MKIPGTDLDFRVWRREYHETCVQAGAWDNDPPTSESLLRVVLNLTTAWGCYKEDNILPASFYRRGSAQIASGGAIYCFAQAVVNLADLGERMRAASPIWEGMSRHHTRDLGADIFSTINRVVRLKEAYPTEAIAMIEKMAATWVSREEFWRVVLQVAERKEV